MVVQTPVKGAGGRSGRVTTRPELARDGAALELAGGPSGPRGLRAILAEHLLGLGWHEGLAFGREADVPFNSEPVNGRAYRAWKKAGLERITLHECRHTFASLVIAAGVNAKALSTYMQDDPTGRPPARRVVARARGGRLGARRWSTCARRQSTTASC